MRFQIRVCTLISICFLAALRAGADESVLDAVDPLLGVRGEGHCVPGPCLPHGSIHPSPDTLRPANGGYRWNDGGGIVGFSQLHVQGSGGDKSYGNFLISPQIGLALDEADHASDATDELARPDCYRVRLARYNILCEVAPTDHAAIYRFSYPESDAASLTIDVARMLGRSAVLKDGSVTIDATGTSVFGGGLFTGNWNPAPYRCYFAAQISKAPNRTGTWIGVSQQADVRTATSQDQRLGAYFQWHTQKDEVINLKIAVSFVSLERAQEYLRSEIPTWNFAAVQTAAKSQWERVLGTVEIDGAAPEQRRKFYTALYHCFVQPRDRTGDNNWSSTAPFWDDQYTLWDTWRTLYPLMAIIQPEMVQSVVNSFLDRHEHNGYVATAFVQGKEFKVGQGGDEVDNVLADAAVKQVPGIDWEKAYALMKFDAEQGRTTDYRQTGWVAANNNSDYGWRLKSAGGTLAFAYNDFCVAQVAGLLGKSADQQKYLARSNNWKNVWDDTLTDGDFRGFPRARRADGSFTTTAATKGYNTDFYEGTCWIYSYAPLHNIPGVVEKMGGPDQFVRRLQYGLTNNLIDFTNEPSFCTIWWLSAVGRPDLTGYWANKLRSLYTPDGYPGDEDSGAMSSLYIFVMAGLMPIAGQDIYYLHGARLPKIVFHLSGGKTFTVIGQNASPENCYVLSAMLNGVPLDHPSITHEQIMAGGSLEFVMGNSPGNWGSTSAATPNTGH